MQTIKYPGRAVIKGGHTRHRQSKLPVNPWRALGTSEVYRKDQIDYIACYVCVSGWLDLRDDKRTHERFCMR